MRTYNIGISGHEMPVCLDNLEAAIRVYQPEKYIIIHTASLSASEQQLRNVLEHTMRDIPSYDHGIIYQLQKIPVLKMLYKQIEQKMQTDFLREPEEDATAGSAEDSGAFLRKSELLKEVLNRKSALCRENGIRLMIAYTPYIEIGGRDGTVS